MLVKSLAIDEDAKKFIIEQDGIKELYPPQSKAIGQGLLDNQNLVIAIPTASGKTLLAELAALKHVLEKTGKVLYLCPLRALAAEKFHAMKRFENLGLRVGITSGDYDSKDRYLPRYDIIVSTNEKIDALLRHGTSWILNQVSLVIIDEFHLLDDQHRGPTLETLLARLRYENSQAQLLALSATVGNADELAEWLDAKLVISDWRPVPLKEGVYYDNYITYADFSTREVPFRRKDQLINIALDSVHNDDQVLVFASSRRSAESAAERIGKLIVPLVTPRDLKHLSEVAGEAAINLTDPLSTKLSETLKRGVTFHHAGLNSQQRELVEQAFKKGYIKILCSTPTLASGINLPAKRVVIASVYRYSVEEGSHPIKTLEYKQMCGRAGRPQFDTEGESLLLAKKEGTAGWLLDRYIRSGPETIYSKLAAKPALRRNILGLIASKVVDNLPELGEFFEKTFYGFQFEVSLLVDKIRDVVDNLIVWEMIEPLDANQSLRATVFGRRISQLYLDPDTAATIAAGLALTTKKAAHRLHVIALLDLIVGTPDMLELSFRKQDWKKTEDRLLKLESKLVLEVPNSLDIDYEIRLRDFKTVLFLWDWIREVSIERLLLRYGIGSGDVRRIIDTATWLITAMSEIAKLKVHQDKNYAHLAKRANELSERVTYGIKRDAVSLTRIRGIGRKRARVLLEHGIKDVIKLGSMNVTELTRIPGFGKELAKSVLDAAKSYDIPKDEESRTEFVNGDISDYLS
ncbi:MAG: DEAD/DEAH box helicase [Candidatus Thorarchaeota archaeon]